MVTSASAVQRGYRDNNFPKSKTYYILITVPVGDITYRLADVIVEGRGDGVIDFANSITKIEEPSLGTGIQFPRGTRFPLTVRTSYSRLGNEISNHSSLSVEEWFDGFYAKIVECIDKNGRSVQPLNRDWPKYKVEGRFMRSLQKLYELSKRKL